MTREIKFRSWDKERMEVREVKLMDWSDWWVSTGSTWERENASEYGERNSFKNEETDRHILMQFTGLKDKNGKEIYEGDIAWDENYEEYCKVEFKEGCFRYTNGTVTQELFERCDQLEIVGNIYENTELLKEQTQ